MRAEVVATDKYGLDVGIKEQCSKMLWALGTTDSRSTGLEWQLKGKQPMKRAKLQKLQRLWWMRGCNSKASIKPLLKKSFELIITKSLVRKEIESTLKKNKGNTNGKVDQGTIRWESPNQCSLVLKWESL